MRALLLRLAILVSLSPLACKDTPPGSPAPQAADTTPIQQPDELTPAERAFLDGRLNRAVELLQVNQRDTFDSLLLAYSLVLLGDESAATRVLDETMRAPHFADEHMFRGLLAVLTGNLDQAIREVGAAGQLQRRRFFPRALHVELLTLAQRFEDAESALEALARDFPHEPIVPHTRGHLESARENWAGAIDAYTHSAELGGPNPDLDDGIAAARIALGQYSEARQVIERCRRSFPDYPEILYQAIRLARVNPDLAAEPLQTVVAEYRSRTKRQDRLAEIATWMGQP